MTNDRSVAGRRGAGWRIGSGLLLVVSLLAGCAVGPPQDAQNADQALEATQPGSTSAARHVVAAEVPTVEDTAPSTNKPWSWHWQPPPSAIGHVPDGDEGAGRFVVALPPPLFTPAQAAAEAVAADEAAAAAQNDVAGGPSIRFKKPFGERGAPSEGAEVDRGTASWYGLQFHGRRTANGERYDMYDLTAAHKTLPFNTIVSVHNLQTGRSVRVRINDRGPYVDGRVIDLSKAAAEQLGMAEIGLRPVSLVVEEWPAEVAGPRGVKRAKSRNKTKARTEAQLQEFP